MKFSEDGRKMHSLSKTRSLEESSGTVPFHRKPALIGPPSILEGPLRLVLLPVFAAPMK